MAVIQGAVWGPHDPDSRQIGGEDMWSWSIPLVFNGRNGEGVPHEDLARLQFEGETFSDLVRNSFAGLQAMGFQGRAHMSSICWRWDYTVLEISEKYPNGVMHGPMPSELGALEEMGEIGE